MFFFLKISQVDFVELLSHKNGVWYSIWEWVRMWSIFYFWNKLKYRVLRIFLNAFFWGLRGATQMYFSMNMHMLMMMLYKRKYFLSNEYFMFLHSLLTDYSFFNSWLLVFSLCVCLIRLILFMLHFLASNWESKKQFYYYILLFRRFFNILLHVMVDFERCWWI